MRFPTEKNAEDNLLLNRINFESVSKLLFGWTRRNIFSAIEKKKLLCCSPVAVSCARSSDDAATPELITGLIPSLRDDDGPSEPAEAKKKKKKKNGVVSPFPSERVSLHSPGDAIEPILYYFVLSFLSALHKDVVRVVSQSVTHILYSLSSPNVPPPFALSFLHFPRRWLPWGPRAASGLLTCWRKRGERLK